jgi:diguanylate cyclase (GGDEF)-like protein
VRSITAAAFLLGAALLFGFWRVLESFRKRIEAEEVALKHQTMHDPLTGLPNRSLLTDRVKQALARAARDSSPVALLLMDIDRFKEVNDTFGHQTGDKLLQQVAFLVRSVLRQSDTVSRLGGDEFGVVLPNTNQNGGIIAADKLFEALSQPLYVEGQSFHMGAVLASPSIQNTGQTTVHFCAARTWRCTPPSGKRPAIPFIQRSRIKTVT